MRRINWPLIWTLIPWALSGCASPAVVSVPACPTQPPVPAALQLPAPPPESFHRCLQALLVQTSAVDFPPSCAQLEQWASTIESFNNAKE